MLILFILGWVLVLIGFYVFAVTSAKQEDFLVGFLSCFLLCIGIATICVTSVEMWDLQPDAIDVYRNKTELQVTYKVVGVDTLSRDTIVVFKQHEN